jgi:hypothetical protein
MTDVESMSEISQYMFGAIPGYARFVWFDQLGTGHSDPLFGETPSLETFARGDLDAGRRHRRHRRPRLGHRGPRAVVVTSTVTDLVVGSGITFDDGAEHILKGIPEPWRLFTVTSRHA